MVKVGGTYKLKNNVLVNFEEHIKPYVKILEIYNITPDQYAKGIIKGTNIIVYFYTKHINQNNITYIATNPKNIPEINNG